MKLRLNMVHFLFCFFFLIYEILPQLLMKDLPRLTVLDTNLSALHVICSFKLPNNPTR